MIIHKPLLFQFLSSRPILWNSTIAMNIPQAVDQYMSIFTFYSIYLHYLGLQLFSLYKVTSKCSRKINQQWYIKTCNCFPLSLKLYGSPSDHYLQATKSDLLMTNYRSTDPNHWWIDFVLPWLQKSSLLLDDKLQIISPMNGIHSPKLPWWFLLLHNWNKAFHELQAILKEIQIPFILS